VVVQALLTAGAGDSRARVLPNLLLLLLLLLPKLLWLPL
jgi:hypothetical protein